MSSTISDSDFNRLRRLFTVSFGESEAVAEEILGFARDYGELDYLEEDGEIATMLCLARLEGGLKYLFAVATDPLHRNKGLFAKNLTKSMGSGESIVCIPERKELFALYQKLGFTRQGHVLQCAVNGSGELFGSDGCDISDRQLYEIYKSSPLYPKKTEELFLSTLKCHRLYGGSVISDGSFYALCWRRNGKSQIHELCLPSGETKRLPALLRGCASGRTTATLPELYAGVLKENGFRCRRKKIYALRLCSEEIIAKGLYINLLYN